MPKDAEIRYVENMVKALGVTPAEVERHLMTKPFTDAARATYLLDIAQVLALLPPPPARLLDLGTGSGWTAELFARCGYTVVGVDIAPDMITLARRRLDERLDLCFEVCDYEAPVDHLGVFDAVVIYDALHHAEHEGPVIATAFRALKEGGVLVTVEPGIGHSATPGTRDVVAKFGTTEKDMPASYQTQLMRAAGFTVVRQYVRLSQLPLEPVTTAAGRWRQRERFRSLMWSTMGGATSIVLAVKGAVEEPREDRVCALRSVWRAARAHAGILRNRIMARNRFSL